MLLILAAATVASLCTGAVTYLFAKPSSGSSSGNTNTSAGIQNTVNLSNEEKHDFTNTLLVILVCLRVLEFVLFALNTFRKTMKKRYSKVPQQQQLAAPAAPA